ncbi:MAG: hypothetical protein ACHQT9_02360 [Candidatus Saccharimonadales bacterium]
MPSKNESEFTARAMQLVGYLAVFYICLIFLMPANKLVMQHYNWTSNDYKFATAATALLSIVVWFIAFWGYSQLQLYAHAIRKSKEGPHFKRLSTGIMWLAWSLPILTIATYALSHSVIIWPSFYNTQVIIFNYVSLIFPLIAFILISTSAAGLVAEKRPNLALLSARITMTVFLAIGVIYCFLVFRTLDLTSLTGSTNPYYLPVWILIMTIIIPFLYGWFVGLLAAYEIMLFSVHIVGLIYKQALLYLSIGLTVIILSAIAIQYVSSVLIHPDTVLYDTGLYLLIIFRIISASGFVLLAIGAHKLMKIEKV